MKKLVKGVAAALAVTMLAGCGASASSSTTEQASSSQATAQTTTADGKSVIRVTSSKPVQEPYLNFLVQVLWPNGRLLREYTVLLDPPLYYPQAAASAPQAPVSAPRATDEPSVGSTASPPASTRQAARRLSRSRVVFIETPHSLPEFDFPIYSIYERPGHFIAEMWTGLVTVL